MQRKNQISNKIALLATGDEICNGDILNTNSRDIAQRLLNQGMHPGTHMAACDQISEIRQAIEFLLKQHRALIITGGLGPTSDDLTRYALSEAIARPLIFDEQTWNAITQRLAKFGYTQPPESNRQQALFPEGAMIIPNPNGTAAGCQIQFENRWIFMLPGPPFECLPMIETHVIPTLMQAGLQQTLYRKSWFLFSVSEGQIAEELDEVTKPFHCTTGYRIFYPYIEFKIFSDNEKEFAAVLPLIEQRIKPFLIHDGMEVASHFLKNLLEKKLFSLCIYDNATGGALESSLKTPENSGNIFFFPTDKTVENSLKVEINGLNDYWENKNDVSETGLEIIFTQENNVKKINVKIPFRGNRVKQYAVEFICWQISLFCTSFP